MNDLFLIIYRNLILRNKIFKEIKEFGKTFKYICFSFYDYPIDLMCITNNQIIFRDKLLLYNKQKKQLFEDPDNVSYRNYYKYHLDYTNHSFESILKWKSLDLELFKLYYNSFKIEIERNLPTKLNDWLKLLVFGNGENVKVLDYLVNEWSLQSSSEFNLGLSIDSEDNKLLDYLNCSIEMLDYIFNNQDKRIKITLTLETILQLVYLLVGNNNVLKEIKIEIVKLIPNNSFKHLQQNPKFKSIKSQIIEMNDYELYTIIKFQCFNNDDQNLFKLFENLSISNTKQSFKNGKMENNLQLFQVYLNEWSFDLSRLYESIELGFKNMVLFLFKNLSLYIVDLPTWVKPKYEMYTKLLQLSLPSNSRNGNPYLFELISQTITNLLTHEDTKIYSNILFSKIYFNCMPSNYLKREQYLLQCNRIVGFSDCKDQYSIKYNTRFTNLSEIVDVFTKHIKINDKLNPYIHVHLFTVSLTHCNFKLLKMVLKRTPRILSFSVFKELLVNKNFKLFFYFISKNLSLPNLDKIFETSTTATQEPDSFLSLSPSIDQILGIPKIVSLQNSSSIFNLLLGLGEFKNFKFFNLLIGDDVDLEMSEKYSVLFKLKLISYLSLKESRLILQLVSESSYPTTLLPNPTIHGFIRNLFIKNTIENQILKIGFKINFATSNRLKNKLLKSFGLFDLLNSHHNHKI